MLQNLLLIGLIPFALALIVNLPSLFRSVGQVRGPLFWVCIAWVALFIAQGQIFAKSATQNGADQLDAGAFYQLSWMALAAVILLMLLIRSKLNNRVFKLPMIMLFAYGALGVATGGFSPKALFSIYKASQLLVDFMMFAIAGSYLVKYDRPRILVDLCIYYLTFVIFSAAIGGAFFPQYAFSILYGGGAFGMTLEGVVPQVHHNELGLLSAVLVIVSIIRMTEVKISVSKRFFWRSALFLALMVAFAAQARTSLFSMSLALLVMTFLVPRLRWLGVMLGVGAFFAVAYYIVSGGSLGIGGEVETYLRRGATDQQLLTMSGRTGLWEAGLRMFSDSPLFGHGFQAGARYAGVQYGIGAGTNMHNGHMQVLVDSGLLGYAAWILFVIPMIWAVITTLVKQHLPIRSEVDRAHLEAALVMFVIFFRTFLGQILVAHALSTMLYWAMYLYVVTFTITSLQKRSLAKT